VTDTAGHGFDFVAAYDAAIGAIVDELGLTEETARRLVPGVRIHLQTREPELMSARTATLNRLAVYLVRRACGRSPDRNFEHVQCANVTLIDPAPGPDASAFVLDCNGRRVEVDTLVIRRGPDRDQARFPFAEMLRDYPGAHDDWTRRFPAEAISPALSDGARSHFARLSREHRLPSPMYRRDADAARAPRRVKVARRDGEARWTGDVALADAATAWDAVGPPIVVTLASSPAELGPLAYALARITLHAQSCTVQADVVRWGPFLDSLTVDSVNAEELERPTLLPVDGSSDLHPEEHGLDQMARRLGEALDRRCLQLIDEHVGGLVDRGADPGHVADLAPAPDVAEAMRVTWAEWKLAFHNDPGLLSRFLRLLVCARDGAAAANEARTLVGPRKRKLLIRATTAALAMAAGWNETSPHLDEPGNLTRGAAAGSLAATLTGHVCAAERIGGRPTSTEAAAFLWGTDFVILPMLTSPVAVAIRAEERLDSVDGAEPTLASAGAQPSLMLGLDPSFKAAIAAGTAELSRLLEDAEAAHRASLAGTLDTGGDRASGPSLENAA
jgi:hypothetical protein